MTARNRPVSRPGDGTRKGTGLTSRTAALAGTVALVGGFALAAPAAAASSGLPALNIHLVQQNGNSVVLGWAAPNIGTLPYYSVFDNGVLQSKPVTAQASLPLLQAGVTHRLTVTYTANGATSPVSNTVSVAIAPTGDTTPPTAPGNPQEHYNDSRGTTLITFTLSTDDVTPQSSIRYELVVTDAFGHDYVVSTNVKPNGVIQDIYGSLRAVDASGNRSALVPITHGAAG